MNLKKQDSLHFENAPSKGKDRFFVIRDMKHNLLLVTPFKAIAIHFVDILTNDGVGVRFEDILL